MNFYGKKETELHLVKYYRYSSYRTLNVLRINMD